MDTLNGPVPPPGGLHGKEATNAEQKQRNLTPRSIVRFYLIAAAVYYVTVQATTGSQVSALIVSGLVLVAGGAAAVLCGKGVDR